jgi:hypothetical protein
MVMKTSLKIIIGVLVFCIYVLSCQGQNILKGKYVLSNDGGLLQSMDFIDKENVVLDYGMMKFQAQYRVDKNNLTITAQTGEVLEFKIKGDTIQGDTMGGVGDMLGFEETSIFTKGK